MKSIRAKKWLISLFDRLIIEKEDALLNYPQFFEHFGFYSELKVYIKLTHMGLEFGYEATKWEGHTPVPYLYTVDILYWEDIESLSKRDKQEKLLLDFLMKTIKTREKDFQKCQYCRRKVVKEHRFNENTCYGCATNYLGIDF